MPISHGAISDRQIRAVILQPLRGSSTPVRDLLDQTLDDQRTLENAPIQQQGIRDRDIDLLTHRFVRGMTMLRQKSRKMAGDGGVGHIRQTEFHHTAALALGPIGDVHPWKETIQHHGLHFIPPQFGGPGCANQSAATAQQRHIRRLGGIVGEEALLGDAALLDQLR